MPDPNALSPQSAPVDGAPRPHIAEETRDWPEVFGNESPFRGAFEHAAIGMALVGFDGRFLKVNRSLCQIVGYSEEELLARDFQSITHSEDLQADLVLAEQLFRGDIDHYCMEKRYFHRQGHVVWIQLSASHARDATGRPCYAIAQVQDITDRKLAEQQSARRLHHLERLTESVSRILRTLENTPDAALKSAILQTVMDAFRSPAGMLLRGATDSGFMGPYISEDGIRTSRCPGFEACRLWQQAVKSGRAVIENQPVALGCGRTPARSLVVPITVDGGPIGILHLCDAAEDYDEHDADLLMRIATIIAPVLHARIERTKLTPREAEVMDKIVEGLTQKQIATALGISVQTTAKHRAHLLEKLNLANDVELVHFSLQMRPVAAEAVTSSVAPPNSRP